MRENRADQLDLFATPRPLPVVDRSGPSDAWIYAQEEGVAAENYCDGDKEEQRAAQKQAWLTGWRPQSPLLCYYRC